MDELVTDDDEADVGYVSYQLQWLITDDYQLTDKRDEADFAICGDKQTGFVEVNCLTGGYEHITYH